MGAESHAPGDRRARHMRAPRALLTGGALALALGVPVLALAPTASAGTSWCSLVAQVQKYETAASTPPSAASLSNPKVFETAYKNDFVNLFAVQGEVQKVAPSQLQAPVKTMFADLHAVYNSLSGVGFNLLKMTPALEKTLTTESQSLISASNKITAYDKSVCHLKS